MINKFIDIIVEGIDKSDTEILIQKIKEKDTLGLTQGLGARKVVLENEKKRIG